MGKTNTTPLFFQVPKIMHEDKKIKAQHIYIFMVLYDQLRQRKYWNKSNKWISEQTKIGINQVKEYLNDLEEYGYIYRLGQGLNRKFFLGIKLTNRPESVPDERKDSNRPESVPVSKSNRPESVPVEAGISASNRPESVLHNKNLFKDIIKNISSSSNLLKSTPKPQEFPPYTAEELNLLKKIDDGTEEVTDLERHRARYLKKRHEKKVN